MTSTPSPGRVAGFLYLLLSIAGPIRSLYIPSKLFVVGNAAATDTNIAAHESLFRLQPPRRRLPNPWQPESPSNRLTWI